MQNLTANTFAHLFENELRLGTNTVCKECDVDPKFKHPLLPWIVGSRFRETKERILFVGKPHRGLPESFRESGVIDATGVVEGLWKGPWAYWNYTRNIAEQLYGENAGEYICFSNLIKCTNSNGVDATTIKMAQSCIEDLGVIWKEMEKIECRTVVFYTHKLFPRLIEEVPIAIPGSIRQITTMNHSVPCGKKKLSWWERSCDTRWCKDLRLLVVGHPERMAKRDYVRLVSEWLKK